MRQPQFLYSFLFKSSLFFCPLPLQCNPLLLFPSLTFEQACGVLPSFALLLLASGLGSGFLSLLSSKSLLLLPEPLGRLNSLFFSRELLLLDFLRERIYPPLLLQLLFKQQCLVVVIRRGDFRRLLGYVHAKLVLNRGSGGAANEAIVI